MLFIFHNAAASFHVTLEARPHWDGISRRISCIPSAQSSRGVSCLRLLLLLCLVDAEIRTGAAGNRPATLLLSLLSSKCRFTSWDSRSKPAPAPGSYVRGASATGTDVTYQSGCSTSGKSRWIQTWANANLVSLSHREPIIKRRLGISRFPEFFATVPKL